MAETLFVSRYDRRVKLVQDVVKAHSGLDDVIAGKIAVQVLHALDTIPEKVR
ncbi:MAG TPA: DUF6307 family protein [Pseudonocardiaceae bacterium]